MHNKYKKEMPYQTRHNGISLGFLRQAVNGWISS